jgi:hypothetical protein
MDELKFDNETAEGLYRILCGVSKSSIDHAEVYDRAKPGMKKAFDQVIEWGRKNKVDCRGQR